MNKGDFVRIEYIGKTDTGEVFDLTSETIAKEEGIYNPKYAYQPIPVVVGEGFVVKGLDEAIESMNVGEEKEVSVSPEKAFGSRDPKLVKLIPESEFHKQQIDPQPGMVFDMQGFKGRIQSVSSGRVRVDFNNPLAGRTLTYKLKIIEKVEKTEEKVRSLIQFWTGIDSEIKLNGKTAEATVTEGRDMPQDLQRQISDIITKYVPQVEEVKFSVIFKKGAESHEGHDHSHDGHDHAHHDHDHSDPHHKH